MALRSVKFITSLLEKITLTGVAVAMLAMLPVAARAQGTYAFTGMTAVGTAATAQNVPVTFAVSGVIASIRVLTGGIATLDYTDTGAGSCTGSTANWISGQSCTVSVQFLPTAPGERRGAILLLDSNGAQLGIEYLYAIGQGPLGVMLPGIIDTIAGNGGWIYTNDGVAATAATLYLPSGVAVDAAGNIYISDSSSNRIRRVDAVSGLISTYAGNGSPGFSGDNGQATRASIDNPGALVLDGAGNLYIADSNNDVIRMVNAATGIITTVAGMGGQQGRTGDGYAATQALLNTPEGLAFDAAGNLYISDMGNNVVRMVNSSGIISTFAGNGTAGYSGDGNSATAESLNSPWGLAAAGNDLYIADLNNNRIRKVSGGVISTVAGTGTHGDLNDGQPALQAGLNNPAGVTVDVSGNLYIADSGNDLVRKVSAVTGLISSIAGTGGQTIGGDGGPSNLAEIYGPYGIALDGLGNLYIADVFHNRIREIYSTQSLQKYLAIRVQHVSMEQPQSFENDGNAPMIFTSIAGVTNGAVDAMSTTCSLTTPLALSTACIVGAEFAPTVTGSAVTGSINIISNAANTPGTIHLSGEVTALDPTVVTVKSSNNPAAMGSSVTFTGAVTATGVAATGTISFMDGAAVLGTASVNTSGIATYTLTSLSLGQHSITAVYNGDANSQSNTSAALTELVKQATSTTLTTSAPSVVNGTSVTFTATVSGGVMPTGSVIFQDGTTAIGNGVLSGSGVTTFSTAALTPGPHSITAVYEGDNESLTSTSAVTKQAVQAATAIAVVASTNPASAGASVQFTMTVTATGSNSSTGAITGNIILMDGPATLATVTPNAAGVATFSTATLALGAHSITASYAGATYYASGVSPAYSEPVEQATTSTMLSSSTNPSIFGASVTFTATVMGTGAAPTGNVTFKDGTTTLGTGTLSGAGKAMFTTSTLAVGSHSIVATYAGDTDNLTSSSAAMAQPVDKATSATTLAATPNPSSQGVYVQFTAVVTSNGNAPTGTVTFMEGTNALGSATLNANGVAAWSTNVLAMGQHTIVAVYQGDAANATSSSASIEQNILPVTNVGLSANHNPGIAGASVSFTATVTGEGSVPTGVVTFKDGAATIGTGALNGAGVTMVATSTLSVGAHSITATYSGDAANASSNSSVFGETIQQATSHTVLTPSANSITRGSSVTLTATVTGNGGTPGGSVAFMDNAQSLGTGSLNGSGVATFATTALTVGQHSLTAQYAGDTNDVGSNSTVIVETVGQSSPSIQVNSGTNPSLAGSGVTFTATLQHGVATPTGTVTWSDGATVLGTSAMSASAASFNANTLSVGPHAITAAYGGDTNNAAATSGVLNQMVQQSTTTTVRSSANQSVASTITHFTATVTGGSGIAPTGSVTFKDGANTLGTGAIVNGTAVFDTTTLSVGLHGITAIYSGDTSSQTSTSTPWTQSVTAATTSVVFTSSANPSVSGALVTFTAAVTGNGEGATGVVTFKDGATVLGTANLSGGTAIFATAALLPGQHSLVAQYGGDSNNQAATSLALKQTVQQKTATTLVSNTNPAMTVQTITLTAMVSNGGATAATGTVSFSDGATVLGTGVLDESGTAMLAVSSLSAGQHVLTASYMGDTLDLVSNSASVSETVQLRASTTSLAASSTTVTTGDPLTLFAAVAGAAVEPTGTVTYYAGTVAIGSATLSAMGVATLNYTPAAGTYGQITAKYSGDAVYAASTSSTLGTITVGQALNFSVTSDPSSVTVQSKQFGVINISMQSLAEFADTMSIGCLGLPSGASCTFNKTQVNLAAGGTQTVQVTLDTSDPLTAGGQAKLETKAPSMTVACCLPAGVLLGLMLWMGRKRLSKDGRRAMGGLLVLTLAMLTIGLSGCAALQINGVAPGTYNVQVFATGTTTRITQSATITLTVTQ